MKKFLRAILGWLDRKFPDQVTVTLAEYNELQAKVKRIEEFMGKFDEWAKKYSERLEKAELAINNLNVTAGLSGLAADKFKVAPFIR